MEKLQINSILYADNDIDEMSIFRLVIKELDPNIKILFVQDSIELMEALDSNSFDLLFLNLDIHGNYGSTCLTEIRKNPAFSNLPIVSFSASTLKPEIQKAYELGANLFMLRPFNFKDYCTTIGAILNFDWSNPNAITEQYKINERYTAFS